MLRVGLEPTHPKIMDFKSIAATYYAIGAVKLLDRFIITPTSLRCKHLLAGVVGIEPTLSESKSDMLPLHNTPTKQQDTFLRLLYQMSYFP